MRITNAQIAAMMHGSMNSNAARLGQLMQQMATGQRIIQPSDDPVASVRVLRLQREEAGIAQYRTNIQTVSGSLSVQETNLTAASDTLLNLRDLLVWAGNDTNGADELRAMAEEMSNIESTLVSFLNVRDTEGRYLLSGTYSDRPAVSFDSVSGTYSVTGNDRHRQAAVATGVLIDENVTVMEVLGPGADFLNEIHSLVSVLSDPALDANDPVVKGQVRGALDALDAVHRKLLVQVSELGGRQNMLTLLDESQGDTSVVNQGIEGALTALDYAGASIDLNEYKLAVQATQQTYLKINQLSLFNLL